MKKLILSMILVIIMVMGFVPTISLQVSAETVSGTSGDYTWSFDSDTGVLTVSGSGTMADYNTDAQPWVSYKDSITSVIIEDGITSIGKNSFYQYSALKTVIIAGSVTSIGNNAFYNCSSLSKVEYWGTTEPTANSYVFSGTRLFVINVPTTYEGDACCGKGINKNLVITVPTYTINVSANQAEYGSVTGSGTYNEDASVVITATPNTGYSFVGWKENGSIVSKAAQYIVTSTTDRVFVAEFEACEWSYPSAKPTTTWTGSGTESDPYIITTAQELADLAWLVNNSYATHNNKYYKLGNDIDLKGGLWTTIGYYDGSNANQMRAFKGVFDGDGKTISGLNVISSEHKGMALFGYLKDGTIKNLTVSGEYTSNANYSAGICAKSDGTIDNCVNNVNITVLATTSGNYYVGGIAAISNLISNSQNNGKIAVEGDVEVSVGGISGQITNGIITDCKNTVEIKGGKTNGYSGTGGICGYIVGNNAIVSDCSNTGKITGTNYVAGIAGSSDAKIENCTNSGDVVANGYSVGGIVGCNYSSSTLRGFVTNCINSGNISGDEKIGGIVGYGEGVVSKCFNTGNIKSTNTNANAEVYVGGIQGYVYTLSNRGVAVNNCYNLGNVSGGSTTSKYVGGICGRVQYNSITNCYSAGTVSNATTSSLNASFYYSGAICGTGTITNCYYLNGTNRSATKKSATEFADGTVCKLLQAPTLSPVWGQTIGTDSYPVFYNGSNSLGSEITGITLMPETITIVIGESYTLQYEVTPSDAIDRTATWSSSDNNIVSVDENGLIKGLSKGTVKISVKSADGQYTDTCVITVNEITILLGSGNGYVLESSEGYTTDIAYGEDYKFELSLNEGYKKGENFAVKVNGEVIEGVDNVYIINNVTESQHITVEGVEKIKYTINYDLDGGYWVDEVGVTEVEYGVLIAVPEVNKKGYTFVKWLDSKLTGTSFLFEAIWEVNTYTITFDSNGGSKVSDIEYTVEEEINELEIPNLEGYKFNGWYDENNNLVEKIILGTTGDLSLKAEWEAVVYTITFNSENGSIVDNVTYTIEDEVIDLANIIPTFSNHEFLGWYDDAGNKVESVDTSVLEDIKLHAKWKHPYGEWKEVLESTYDMPGKKERKCECGAIEVKRTPVKNIAGILEDFLNDLFNFISSFFEQLTNIIDSLSANPDDEETKEQATEDLYDLYFE